MSGSCWLFLTLFLLATEKSVSKDIRVGRCWVIMGGSCPDNKHITFHLYTRKNKEASQRIRVTDTKDNLAKTFFNDTYPNKVVIHGFNAHVYIQALRSIKDAYLEAEEANVWMVDWSELSQGGLCVPLSMQNTGHVGECLSQLVKAVQRYTPHPHFHVVASGAGATVAHYLARAIHPNQLARITALNPAVPPIQTSRAQDQMLDDDDAEFVDIIHTTAFMHQQTRMGHFDVYCNPRGFHQPGCRKESNSDECDRLRGFAYFAESILSEEKFLAWPCEGYKYFLMGLCAPEEEELEAVGEPSSDWARGLYITFTASEPPYALGPWDGDLFKERGPALHNGRVSQISTKIKKKIDYVKENTPDVIQDFYLVEKVKNHFNNKADGIKNATTRAGLNVGGEILQHTVRMIRNKKNQNIQSDTET